MLLPERIKIDPRVCHGRPVVKGTRIWVSVVLNMLAEGKSHEYIIQNFPPLTEADIRACTAFGALLSTVSIADLATREDAA